MEDCKQESGQAKYIKKLEQNICDIKRILLMLMGCADEYDVVKLGELCGLFANQVKIVKKEIDDCNTHFSWILTILPTLNELENKYRKISVCDDFDDKLSILERSKSIIKELHTLDDVFNERTCKFKQMKKHVESIKQRIYSIIKSIKPMKPKHCNEICSHNFLEMVKKPEWGEKERIDIMISSTNKIKEKIEAAIKEENGKIAEEMLASMLNQKRVKYINYNN